MTFYLLTRARFKHGKARCRGVQPKSSSGRRLQLQTSALPASARTDKYRPRGRRMADGKRIRGSRCTHTEVSGKRGGASGAVGLQNTAQSDVSVRRKRGGSGGAADEQSGRGVDVLECRSKSAEVGGVIGARKNMTSQSNVAGCGDRRRRRSRTDPQRTRSIDVAPCCSESAEVAGVVSAWIHSGGKAGV